MVCAARAVCAAVIVCAAVAAVAEGADTNCSALDDCAQCTRQGGCVWVTTWDCKQECIPTPQTDITDSTRMFFRGSATSDESLCESHNHCLPHTTTNSTVTSTKHKSDT